MLAQALLLLTRFIFAFAEFVIGMRIILKLFGASPRASFVTWVYENSAPLLQPFMGMFPSPALTSRFVIEFSALFALLAYAFIGYIINEMILIYIRQQETNEQKVNRRVHH